MFGIPSHCKAPFSSTCEYMYLFSWNCVILWKYSVTEDCYNPWFLSKQNLRWGFQLTVSGKSPLKQRQKMPAQEHNRASLNKKDAKSIPRLLALVVCQEEIYSPMVYHVTTNSACDLNSQPWSLSIFVLFFSASPGRGCGPVKVTMGHCSLQ